MNILCIGEALIDMVCTDKGVALSEGNQFLAKPGGAPANAAAAIAAMGGGASLVAKVGNDAFGDKLIHTMAGFGVSTKWMSRSMDHFTTMAFVSLQENGERDFLFNRGADGMLGIEDLDPIPLDDMSIIHFGSATAFLPGLLQNAYGHMLQKAKDQNKIISFDPNYRQLLFADQQESFVTQSWHFLSNCHFCKCSEEEAMLLTGRSSLSEAVPALMERTDAVCAITLGSEGALLCLGGKTYKVPGVKIKCIDSIGAGDAFVGAVLYQLRNKTRNEFDQLSPEEWQEIIAFANKAGARVCEFVGALEAYRNIE
jgi:fructokinase